MQSNVPVASAPASANAPATSPPGTPSAPSPAAAAMDRINLRTMTSPKVVHVYAQDRDLDPNERVALDTHAQAARGKPILDIGVGGGRTVQPLLELSSDYLGIDYSLGMVEACRQAYPQVNFRHLDARRMDGLPDGHFALAFFGCQGICMVAHDDRLMILREVFRVLRPGGIFLFTTFNRDSPQYARGFRLPYFPRTRHPLRLARNTLRYTAQALVCAYNHARLRRHEVRTPAYSIINDVWHDFATMQYYIGLAEQRRQLEAIGFEPDAVAYDKDAKLIGAASTSHFMMFVARKPARATPTADAQRTP
jgi:SAM-dependent methyltransferase